MLVSLYDNVVPLDRQPTPQMFTRIHRRRNVSPPPPHLPEVDPSYRQCVTSVLSKCLPGEIAAMIASYTNAERARFDMVDERLVRRPGVSNYIPADPEKWGTVTQLSRERNPGSGGKVWSIAVCLEVTVDEETKEKKPGVFELDFSLEISRQAVRVKPESGLGPGERGIIEGWLRFCDEEIWHREFLEDVGRVWTGLIDLDLKVMALGSLGFVLHRAEVAVYSA